MISFPGEPYGTFVFSAVDLLDAKNCEKARGTQNVFIIQLFR